MTKPEGSSPAPAESSTRRDPPTPESLALLQRRCADSQIKTEEAQDPDGTTMLRILMPNGRDTRPVLISTQKLAERLLDIPFERFTFLGDYSAIASYEDGRIEAALQPLGQGLLPVSYVFRRLLGEDMYPGRDSDSDIRAIELKPDGKTGSLAITLEPMSRELQVLSRRPFPRASAICICIRGLRIDRHDQALDMLERLANSLFFQIDLSFDIPLAIGRDRRRVLRPKRAPDPTKAQPELFLPTHDFPAEPSALYWYARSALGMPLLQFLAFYQSLEFFFPIYSRTEAQRRLRNFLKDPTFNPERDTDLSRLLSTIRSAPGGFGDERSQLKATIQECIAADTLRAFIQEDGERVDFLSTDKNISTRRVHLSSQTADLRSDVADRIYDIRCKIVHTKSSDGQDAQESLMPFSREADALSHDVAIIQFIARQVLIASGSPLRL